MTSRSFRLDVVEIREQWMVTRTSACRRQQPGFPRYPVLRCFAEHLMNPFRALRRVRTNAGPREPVPMSIAGTATLISSRVIARLRASLSPWS